MSANWGERPREVDDSPGYGHRDGCLKLLLGCIILALCALGLA